MQFAIPKSSLLAALRLAAGVADRKSTQPILGNVLLRVSKRTLLVAATDLNVSLSAEVELDAKSKPTDGGLTIAAKALHDIVSTSPAESITLKRTDNNWAEIVSGKVKTKVVGIADRDFPKLPDHRETSVTTVDAGRVMQLIDRTLFSVCQDETRHHLNGVLLTGDGKTVTAVSTDGHRLSVATSPIELRLPTDGIIVPLRGLVAMRQLLKSAESCSLAVDKGCLFVRVDNTTLAVKLIDAKFPPWQQVVPTKNNKSFTVGRAALIDSLRRMQLMTTDTRGVKMTPSDDGITLTADHPDTGEVVETIDCAADGKLPTVGANPKYVLELLSAMSSDEVVIRLGGELDPMLVEQLDDDSYRGVVMPMRV